MEALAAGFWGFVGGAALLIGAVVGLYANVSRRIIAVVMAVGAGVLVASVAFELMEEAYDAGGFGAASAGLILGALAYFAADGLVSRRARDRKRSEGQQEDGSATAITIGALMDGIPESVAIGASLIGGGSVSAAMVAAVFLSNVPEGLSAAAGMRKAGHPASYVLGLWGAVAVASALAALFGYLFLAGAPSGVVATIQAFAAGAILTMLASTMMPEAYEEGGAVVGLVTTGGFLIAFVLSRLE
ncbi:ZIP family zinc transporter [Rubrobacter marinus]|uniref:ZIP family zinc transporter n=1 Tax=Rubrobacter marinus TaxID=2653852 RepID=A0A6G8PT54_9ACTN|nr:ZIP family zinc transporter [Rubrobacter marinus]QIN77610.1 ZIP family zinc transporter [Rubrobacter marinus]